VASYDRRLFVMDLQVAAGWPGRMRTAHAQE